MLAKFLQLSQLDKFVASSHGTLYKQVAEIEQLINQFGSDEGLKLALEMPQKKISICQDETSTDEAIRSISDHKIDVVEELESGQNHMKKDSCGFVQTPILVQM